MFVTGGHHIYPIRIRLLEFPLTGRIAQLFNIKVVGIEVVYNNDDDNDNITAR